MVYNDLDELRQLKSWLTDDKESYKLPKDIFLFMAHQRAVFFYFHTRDENQYPPVYRDDGEDNPPIHSESLSMSLTEFIKEHEGHPRRHLQSGHAHEFRGHCEA